MQIEAQIANGAMVQVLAGVRETGALRSNALTKIKQYALPPVHGKTTHGAMAKAMELNGVLIMGDGAIIRILPRMTAGNIQEVQHVTQLVVVAGTLINGLRQNVKLTGAVIAGSIPRMELAVQLLLALGEQTEAEEAGGAIINLDSVGINLVKAHARV